jgi:hypothetical protein
MSSDPLRQVELYLELSQIIQIKSYLSRTHTTVILNSTNTTERDQYQPQPTRPVPTTIVPTLTISDAPDATSLYPYRYKYSASNTNIQHAPSHILLQISTITSVDQAPYKLSHSNKACRSKTKKKQQQQQQQQQNNHQHHNPRFHKTANHEGKNNNKNYPQTLTCVRR